MRRKQRAVHRKLKLRLNVTTAKKYTTTDSHQQLNYGWILEKQFSLQIHKLLISISSRVQCLCSRTVNLNNLFRITFSDQGLRGTTLRPLHLFCHYSSSGTKDWLEHFTPSCGFFSTSRVYNIAFKVKVVQLSYESSYSGIIINTVCLFWFNLL